MGKKDAYFPTRNIPAYQYIPAYKSEFERKELNAMGTRAIGVIIFNAIAKIVRIAVCMPASSPLAHV